MKKSIMFGLCFLSIINAQEKGLASPITFANLHSELESQMGRFSLTSPSDSDDELESSQGSPSAAQDILAQAFVGLTELNRQHQKALQEILRITGQNTRATELLGQVVTAQSRLLIDVQEGHKSLLEQIAALRLARESDRQAQNKREQENRERCHEWLLEIRNQSGRNEALALIGGVLFGIGFACQMILDNINAASSGHH